MLNVVKNWWNMSHNAAMPKFQKSMDLSHLADTVSMAKDGSSFTPDAVQLEKKAWQPVFICCQLGKGGTEHHHIDGHCKLTDDEGRSTNMAVLTTDRFELWQALRGEETYPIALRTKSKPASMFEAELNMRNARRSALLKGKLYQIRSDMMFILDRIRHNGVVFNRELIDCQIPFRFLGGQQLGEARLSHEYTRPAKAWFYVAENEFWEPLIDGGSYFKPARLVRPRHPEFRKWAVEPYYMFNPREYAHTE